MENIFQSDVRRHISEANINFYKLPFVHPERILDEHDFIYMLEGEWKFGQNEETFTLKEDQILILTAGNRHLGLAPCSANTKTMYFHTSQEERDRPRGNNEAISQDDVLVDTLIDVSDNKRIKKYFLDIVNNKLSGNERKASIYFDLLLCELSEKRLRTSNIRIESKIMDLIHNNPEKFFSNAELAQMVNVSVKTAENKFKATFGKTIHQYILDFKISEAKHYFNKFKGISVKEVAYNLGFCDEYHFSNQFSKRTGISPSKYKTEI